MSVRSTRARALRVALVLVVAVTGALSACSSGAETEGPENATETPTVPAGNGDSCTDAVGDVDAGSATDPAVFAQLAGMDLTSASAERRDDVLDVRFTTAGPISLLPQAMFVVAQGDPLQPLSYEIRAVGQQGTWQVVLVTWPSGVEQRKTVPISPTVQGSTIGLSVPLVDLPPVASVLQFGSSADTGGATPAIDECSSLTPPSTASTPTSSGS